MMTSTFCTITDPDGDEFRFSHNEDNPGDGYALYVSDSGIVYVSRRDLEKLAAAIITELEPETKPTQTVKPPTDGGEDRRKLAALKAARQAVASAFEVAEWLMSGNDTHATGPHLHIRSNGAQPGPIDPSRYTKGGRL